MGWKGSSQAFLAELLHDKRCKGHLFGLYLGEFYDPIYTELDKDGFICSSTDSHYKNAVLNAGSVFENTLSPLYGTTTEYRLNNGRVEPVLDSINVMRNKNVEIVQNAVHKYFELMSVHSDICNNHLLLPSREEFLENI